MKTLRDMMHNSTMLSKECCQEVVSMAHHCFVRRLPVHWPLMAQLERVWPGILPMGMKHVLDLTMPDALKEEAA
jgi:Prolamin-like